MRADLLRLFHQLQARAAPHSRRRRTSQVEINSIGIESMQCIDRGPNFMRGRDQKLIGKRFFAGGPDQVRGDDRTFDRQTPCGEHFRRQETGSAESADNLPERTVGEADHGRKKNRRIDGKISDFDLFQGHSFLSFRFFSASVSVRLLRIFGGNVRLRGRLLIYLRERQGECKHAPSSLRARRQYFAAVVFDNLAGYGKSEARAFDRCGQFIIGPVEFLEYEVNMFCGNSYARIGDLNHDLRIRFRLLTDRNMDLPSSAA